jgi:hypothetical protein
MKAGAYDQAKQEALARTKRRKRDPGRQELGLQRLDQADAIAIGIDEFAHQRPAAFRWPGALGGGRLGLPTSKTRRTSNTAGQQEAVEEMGYSEG